MPEKKPPKKTRPKKSSFSKQTEQSLLASILKSLPGSIYWKNCDGKYLGCNDSLLEMTGMTSVLGKTDFDMPWADSANLLRDNDLKVMALNKTLDLEEPITLADGQQRIVLTRKTPLYDAKGHIIGILGTSLNITERKKQESTLQFSHEKTQATLESIVAHMPGHVYWKDRQGIYLGCNNRQARSLGFQYGYEVVGKTDFELPWGEDKALQFRKNDLHIMETGETIIIEEKAQVDGKNATVLSHKSPMRDKEGEITGILGISIDISDRKKLADELTVAKEKAEAANLAKTEFLENMRHDIRTPLTGIVGFSELIQAETKNTQIKEYADNLIASSYALLDFMDEVLEAIRVSSGEIPKLKKKLSLQPLLQQVIDLNNAKACAKQLNLSFDFDEAIPQYLLGDSIRIHRIVLELIANALNFTDVGFVKLSATLAKKHRREVIIKLIVEDSGIGIPADKQQEIFLQFKRLTPSYHGIYKGAGLGLAVIKQFVDDLGGEIYVESTLKEGTRFICVIPLQEALLQDDTGLEIVHKEVTSRTTNSSSPQQATLSSEESKHTILVVEDNLIAQKVATKVLSQLDCQVDVAADGQTALMLWKSKHYDLIFMDIGLPDLDGYQVTHRIRVQEITKNTHIPIIALTAHVGEENNQRCIESGMNAVIAKPMTLKQGSDLLDSFISTRKKDKQTLGKERYAVDLPETKEELFDLSSFPLLDSQEGLKTTGTEELLLEMLKLMIEDSLPQELTQMKEAHKQGDWDKTQQIAHKIKGGTMYVGTVRMKMACQYFERYWKTGQRDLLTPLYQQMLSVIDESLQAIKQWLAEKN